MAQPPRMTLVIPLRLRLQFTTNLLPTALLYADRKDHEVIIVVDRCPIDYELDRRSEQFKDRKGATESFLVDQARVDEYLTSHKSLLDSYNVKVLESHGDARCWTGGLRSAQALNVGVEASTTDWIVGIGDEDLCFLEGWDTALWRGLEGRDPMKTVSTLTMVMPRAFSSWPSPFDAGWIHAQRSLCCHQLSYPVLPEHAFTDKLRINELSWRTFARTACKPGIHEEKCGDRGLSHWVPMLMHKPLLNSVWNWWIDDSNAFSYDIELDNRLQKKGVMKRMPLDAHVLHAKHYLHINTDVDDMWASPHVLAETRNALIL